jgi:fumarate reductase (CoM/CoB) subunit B
MLVIKRLAEGDDACFDDLDSLSTCTTCGICTESCPAGVDPPKLIEDARRVLVSSGMMTDKQASLKEKVNLSSNALGDLSARHGWLSIGKKLPDKADLVYFAGCLDSYRYPETAVKTFDVLRRFGATLLPDEKCCGSPLLRTGFDASKLIESNVRQMKDVGAKTVITGCAGCYTTLKNDYPDDFEVVSMPEFLADHISELNLKQLDLTVTYHDPCHLGRHHRIYEEPRAVIKAICDLKEMRANRDHSRCCGGGGGVRSGYSELSLKMARKRLLDVPAGVHYIVTSCPLCIRNLNDAGGDGKVTDLVELVSKSIQANEKRPWNS